MQRDENNAKMQEMSADRKALPPIARSPMEALRTRAIRMR